MYTNIYLIRHGLVEYPCDSQSGLTLVYGPEAPLSSEGRAQVERLGERLVKEGHQVDVLYTSPFSRATETAVILSKYLGNPSLINNDDLRDINNTLSVGLPLEDFIAGKVKPRDPLPGEVVETHEMLLMRTWKFMQMIVNEQFGKRVGVVSHGDWIRVLKWRLENPKGVLPSTEWLKQTDYLGPGEVWRLSVDLSLRLVEQEYIGRPAKEFGRGERML